MRVRVEFLGQLRETTGCNETSVDIGKDSTIRELIAALAKRYGKKFEEQIIPGELADYYTVLLNGKILPASKYVSTLLKENDSIVLMPEVIP